jgi:hypothetical protein
MARVERYDTSDLPPVMPLLLLYNFTLSPSFHSRGSLSNHSRDANITTCPQIDASNGLCKSGTHGIINMAVGRGC